MGRRGDLLQRARHAHGVCGYEEEEMKEDGGLIESA